MEKVKLYRTHVFEGGLAISHNMPMTIWEIFIPSENIVVNDEGGCFINDKLRKTIDGKIIEIEVSNEFVQSCVKRIKSNKKFEEDLTIFEKIKKHYDPKLKTIEELET